MRLLEVLLLLCSHHFPSLLKDPRGRVVFVKGERGAGGQIRGPGRQGQRAHTYHLAITSFYVGKRAISIIFSKFSNHAALFFLSDLC